MFSLPWLRRLSVSSFDQPRDLKHDVNRHCSDVPVRSGQRDGKTPETNLYEFMRGKEKRMVTPLKGRPRLNIRLVDILRAVRVHGNQSRAAADLGCSEGSVRKQIRLAGLDLKKVLAADDVKELLPMGRGIGPSRKDGKAGYVNMEKTTI